MILIAGVVGIAIGVGIGLLLKRIFASGKLRVRWVTIVQGFHSVWSAQTDSARERQMRSVGLMLIGFSSFLLAILILVMAVVIFPVMSAGWNSRGHYVYWISVSVAASVTAAWRKIVGRRKDDARG